MNVRKLVAVTVCGGCLVGANIATAQQAAQKSPQTQQVQGQTGQVGQHAQWMNADQSLATCVAIGNQEEIAIAKFAEQKAQSQEVKDFARMLVKDHQAFLQKLQRYAPEATREGYLMDEDQTTANANQRANQNQPQRPQVIQQTAGTREQAAGTRENAENRLDFVALHRELAENCIRQAKEGLSKKDSAKFDECFVGHQIAKHEEMKSKLTVFERHASSDLKQIFAEGRQTTEQHLKKAEDLMKKLADSDANRNKQASNK